MESGREGGGEVKTAQTPFLLDPLPQRNLWGQRHTAGANERTEKRRERADTLICQPTSEPAVDLVLGGGGQTHGLPRDGGVTGNG